eukprot:gb/GEZN01001751.1/.p1 GENE.gb/GEZN01001751.1/~~gb/GEZN01001751.1/.p1  ORF type:complete len:907 (-),score=186.18 gb/GEZN01001751.1/:123-2558(-)
MSAVVPLNTQGTELRSFTDQCALNETGDVGRLYFLLNKVSALGHVQSQYTTCMCSTSKCLLQLLKAFHHLRGSVNLLFVLLDASGPLRRLALTLLYQTCRFKHTTYMCNGSLLQLDGTSSSSSFSPTASLPPPSRSRRGSADSTSTSSSSPFSSELAASSSQLWDPYSRQPFTWYLQTLAMHKEIPAELVQTILDLLMNAPSLANAPKAEQLMEGPAANTNASAAPPHKLHELVIADTDLLPALFLAASSGDGDGQRLALGFVIALVTNPHSGQDNCNILIQQARFETWIFQFLVLEQSMRDKPGDFQSASNALTNLMTPRRKIPQPTQQATVYNLALRLLCHILFDSLNKPIKTRSADCPIKGTLLWRILSQSLPDYAGGPYPDVLKATRKVLQGLAFLLRRQAVLACPLDISFPLWSDGLFRFLMVCEEHLLYSPLPGGHTTFSSSSDVKWGPQVDSAHHTPMRGLEFLLPVCDLLSVLGTRAQEGGSGEQRVLQDWYRNKILPEYRYMVRCRMLLQMANLLEKRQQQYVHHMTELAALMTDRNKQANTLILPLHRRKLVVNLSRSALQFGPEQVMRELRKVQLAPPSTTDATFQEELKHVFKLGAPSELSTDLIVDAEQVLGSSSPALAMPTPESLGIHKGLSLFYQSGTSTPQLPVLSSPPLPRASSVSSYNSRPSSGRTSLTPSNVSRLPSIEGSPTRPVTLVFGATGKPSPTAPPRLLSSAGLPGPPPLLSSFSQPPLLSSFSQPPLLSQLASARAASASSPGAPPPLLSHFSSGSPQQQLSRHIPPTSSQATSADIEVLNFQVL